MMIARMLPRHLGRCRDSRWEIALLDFDREARLALRGGPVVFDSLEGFGLGRCRDQFLGRNVQPTGFLKHWPGTHVIGARLAEHGFENGRSFGSVLVANKNEGLAAPCVSKTWSDRDSPVEGLQSGSTVAHLDHSCRETVQGPRIIGLQLQRPLVEGASLGILAAMLGVDVREDDIAPGVPRIEAQGIDQSIAGFVVSPQLHARHCQIAPRWLNRRIELQQSLVQLNGPGVFPCLCPLLRTLHEAYRLLLLGLLRRKVLDVRNAAFNGDLDLRSEKRECRTNLLLDLTQRERRPIFGPGERSQQRKGNRELSHSSRENQRRADARWF